MQNMNKNTNIDISNICRICFGNNSLRVMTHKDIYKLQNIMTQIPYLDAVTKLCVYCSSLLNKFMKFFQKCHDSSRYLSQIYENGLKCIHPIPNEYTQSPVQVTYYLPESDADGVKMEDEFMTYRQEDDALGNSDNDDLPLSMLNRTEELGTQYEHSSSMADVKSELTDQTDEHRATDLEKRKKSARKKYDIDKKRSDRKQDKKISSRMVLETNEYVVIKLSKEEVLQEMEIRAKSYTYQRAPYKCDKCVKGFNYEDVLNNHMVKHSMEHGTILCDICSQYCPSIISMRGHMKSHTTRYKCKICGEVRLSRQHLLEHHAINHMPESVTYTCERCDFVTNKRTVIQRHVKTHGPRAEHACDKCGQLFKNIESLRAHTRRHDEASLLQCDQCSRRFVYKSLLEKHVELVHEKRDYYCVECDVRFKSPDNLRIHFIRAKKHRNAASYKYQCPECPSRFVRDSSLSVHLSSVHGHQRAHPCALCPRTYGSRDALRCHNRRAHSSGPVRKHPCESCDKVFTQKSLLVRHRRVHTGERPFSCPVCPLRFAQPSTRDTHHALVHLRRPRNEKKLKSMNNIQNTQEQN